MILRANISIDPDHVIGEVRDYLYGANLEHIGQSVYGGVWAEMLRDRKFAGHDWMYTTASEGLHNVNPNIGVVVPWEAVNPDYANVRFIHDNTTYYSGQQSQRITIIEADGNLHGIKQRGLYVQAEASYDIRIVLKGEGQKATLRLDNATWSIDSISDQWTTYETTLTPKQTNPNGEFSITTAASGTLWIGCASVMPSDNLHGFRADVIAALRDWQPTFLRWPGGNFVSAYDWRLGIGERDKRPSYLDSAWHQWETNDVGTDEFIKLCELVGSDPVLTINMGTGTASEAADWVEYCNGTRETEYGAIRTENGSTTPYNLKTWFVGNEQFGNWQAGHVDAETYANRYLEFAQAMRSVDDSLELIAVGVPTDLYGHWNELVVKKAGQEIDQLSVHYYSIRTEKWETPPTPEQLYLPKLAAAHEVEQMLEDTITRIDGFTSAPMPIAFDEWNTYIGAKPPDFIEDYNLADALYTAALMNACIQRCDRIRLSAIFNLINVMGSYLVYPKYEWTPVNLGRGGGWVATSIIEQDVDPVTIKMPSTLVLELMTRYRGDVAVKCEVTSPGFSSPAAGNLPAYDGIPIVHAATTYDTTSEKLYISIVNRSVDHPVELDIEGIENWDRSGEAMSYTVTGDTPLATNDLLQPDAVQITSVTFDLSSPIVIAPHSFHLLVLGGD
jgi:alpha-N-arabinofuranosidase